MKADLFLIGLAVLGGYTSAGAHGLAPVASWVFDGLQRERDSAGAPSLERQAALDAIAADRGRQLAKLPHARRLDSPDDISGKVRTAGFPRLRRAATHVDMLKGYSSPAPVFLRRWRDYRQAWGSALDPAFGSVGLAVVSAEDGWVILVAVLVEEIALRDDLPQLERAAVDAVNRERVSRGLEPLELREDLSRIAREHSEDMARRDYFDHRSPAGFEPYQRVERAGLRYRQVGENLHVNHGVQDPVATAVDSWMGSRGHRAQILEVDYRLTGLGLAMADDGRIYFTQLFMTPTSDESR